MSNSGLKREGKKVLLRQGFHLFDAEGKEVGNVKASGPGMMRILVWELGTEREHYLDYGDFTSLNEAVSLVGDPYGPEKTIFICFNAKGREIWREPYIVAAEITQAKRVGVEDLDPSEFKKATMGRVKIFISGVSTEAPEGSPPNLYGEVDSAEEAFSLVAENYGSVMDGVVLFFSFYDDQGTCLFSGSQVEVLEYLKG